MEIFGIGPFELVLVALIAFIVLGPERIPAAMRQLGKTVRQLREVSQNITKDYGADIQQLTGEIMALQDEIRGIQRDLGQVGRDLFATASSAPPPSSNPPAPPPPTPPPSVEPSTPAADAQASETGDSFSI